MLLKALVSALMALHSPTVKAQKHYTIVKNAGYNTYIAPEAVYHTVDCTVNSRGPAIVENGAKAWITFLDFDGEYEGDCQLTKEHK